VPMAVLYVNYGRLAAYLWKRNRAAHAGSTISRGGGRTTPHAARSIKMLGTVAVLFLAAWAPYFTITTIEVIVLLFSYQMRRPLWAYSVVDNISKSLQFLTAKRSKVRHMR